MVAVNIKAFRGAVPRVNSRLLQPNQASIADNCKITSGGLEPIRRPALVHTSQLADIQTAYFWRALISGRPQDNWLVWNSDVDIVRSLVPNDPEQRFYFSSADFEPRISTYTLAVSALPYPKAWYALGVFAPSTKLTASVSGGSGTLETRFYAYTYVTTLGEESPPSPPSDAVTGYPNGTWSLSDMQTAPPNTGSVSAATSIGGEQVSVTLNTTFGLSQYDTITFASVGGMTDLNGTFRIQSLGPTANTLVVNLDTAQTYTSGGSWTKTAPHNTTGMTKRIYRTVGTGGDFLFVAEIAVATTSYTDAVVADDLGEILPTADSLLPPKNLVSLTNLPNGCLVGIAGNEICFSDPYMPYSWPLRNRYTISGVGVDLVAAGNSVIVLTDSYPVLFTGSDPEAMSPSVMQTYAPCIAKRGVVDVGGGAMYPSFDGLWIVAPGRVEKLTQKLYREEDWRLLRSQTFVAGFVDGQYYARYYDDQNIPYTWLFDTAENDSVVRIEQDASYYLRNDVDGELYLAQGNKVYRWDSSPTSKYVSDWVSSDIQLPRPTNFSVAQIHAPFIQVAPPDETVLQNNIAIYSNVDLVGGALNADSFLAVEINGSALGLYETVSPDKVQFSLYADGNIVYSRTVTSSEPFRLPSGYLSEVYNVGLTTTIPMYSVTVADSVVELAQASQ
jgi:hypothetical protein